MAQKRVRTSDQRIAGYCLVDVWNSNNVQSLKDYHLAVGYTGEISTMSDILHPGYAKAKARGDIILSDMELSKWSRTASSSYIASPFWPGWGKIVYSGDVAAMAEGAFSFSGSSSVTESMKDAVLHKAYAKVNSSSLMLGEFVSDLDRTVGSLKRPFGGARDLLEKMLWHIERSRRRKTFTTLARACSSAWLEYRYGWKPLILDGASIIEQAHNLYYKAHKKRRRFVARSGDSFPATITGTLVVTPDVAGAYVSSGSAVLNINRTCNAGVICEVLPQQTADQLAKVMGYRPHDYVTTVWEIIPYSFVVDWFINVGDWLQAVVPVPSVNYLGNWVTDVNVSEYVFSGGNLRRTYGLDGHQMDGLYNGSVIKSTYVHRQANREISYTPVLTAKSLSMLHTTDALALSCGKVMSALEKVRH